MICDYFFLLIISIRYDQDEDLLNTKTCSQKWASSRGTSSEKNHSTLKTSLNTAWKNKKGGKWGGGHCLTAAPQVLALHVDCALSKYF